MQDEDYKISATLDKETKEKLEKISKDNERSISAQLRVMIKEWKNWLAAQIQNVVRCMWETILIVLTVILQYQEKKRGLKFETSLEKTWMDFFVFPWKY